MPRKTKEVFLSYSYDDEKHIQTVLGLSNRLREEGVDSVLDQYEQSPPEGWPRWMDRKIRQAHFVLVICTEEYNRRLLGGEPNDSGLGVRWEGTIIYQHIYNAGTNNTKFIPVLLRSADSAHIPTPLQGATRYCVATQRGYDSLYARLVGQPKVEKPRLGRRRALKKKKVKTRFGVFLSTPIDIDLWNNAKWRGTFYITGGNRPPGLGLVFTNRDAAQKIFEGWFNRFGRTDKYEEIRVSIVEGDIRGEEPGYTVHIGPDPENIIKRGREEAGLKFDFKKDGFLGVSRLHRMNPQPDSQNLERFKAAYRHHKSYILMPTVLEKSDNVHDMEFSPELGIHKGLIHFRRVDEIVTAHDLDTVVLEMGKVKRPNRTP